jgi:Fe-S cluster assembly scaffold protein SufB
VNGRTMEMPMARGFAHNDAMDLIVRGLLA